MFPARVGNSEKCVGNIPATITANQPKTAVHCLPGLLCAHLFHVKHFFKVLKDVGMEVPKSVETRKHIYTAKQAMMACNNNNVRNPIK